ncbi:hypothetical protein K2X85_19020 [bacterium]|nr:hypothetical protein [bacterium]
MVSKVKTHTIQIGWLDDVFEFDLCVKDDVQLGDAVIRQFWLPINKIHGNRSTESLTGNARTMVDFFRTVTCNTPDASKDVWQMPLYMELAPMARSIGSRRVFKDARCQRHVIDKAATDLNNFLAEPLDPSYLMRFAAKTRELLCPPTIEPNVIESVTSLESEVFDEAMKWAESGSWEKAVDVAKRKWIHLRNTIGKRGRQRAGSLKRAMDVMSWNMRESVHYAYTYAWKGFLQENSGGVRDSEAQYFFHAFWNCLPHNRNPKEWEKLPSYFNGHVMGLHPAGSILIRASRGQKIIGDAITQPEKYFGHFLAAYEMAIYAYDLALNDQSFNRQQPRHRTRPQSDL